MAKERVFNLDLLSEDYVMDYILYDKYTYERIMERKKANAKKAVKSILDFLDRK